MVIGLYGVDINPSFVSILGFLFCGFRETDFSLEVAEFFSCLAEYPGVAAISILGESFLVEELVESFEGRVEVVEGSGGEEEGFFFFFRGHMGSIPDKF